MCKTDRRRRLRCAGAILVAAAILGGGALTGIARAAERHDGDHGHYHGPGRRDWHGSYYPPPVVYNPPYGYPPPIVYGPGIGINLPGGVSIGIP